MFNNEVFDGNVYDVETETSLHDKNVISTPLSEPWWERSGQIFVNSREHSLFGFGWWWFIFVAMS